MSLKKNYSVTVVPDKEVEGFCTSSCNCDVCRSIHIAQMEWDSFKPKTRLQHRMKDVVAKIENNIATGKYGEIPDIPLYMSG